MIWRNPLAWIGLAALLVPIAIHLLVRQQAQPLPFPSLRFLQASRLAAVKRRRLSDWLLLALRLLILAAAVAALANPFFVSERRRAEWASRVARVVIVDTPAGASAPDGARTASGANPNANANAAVDADAGTRAKTGATAAAAGNADGSGESGAVRVDAVNGAILDPALAAAVQAETATAFASTVFATTDLSGGVTHALAWLASAPPAAREIVIVSPLTRGRVSDAIGADLPAHVGLRFTRVGATESQRRAEGRPASMRLDADNAASHVDIARTGGAETMRAGDRFATRIPTVTAHVDRTDVQWRADAPSERASRNTAPAPAAQLPGTFDLVTEPTALVVRALGLRVEATARELPAARAALDAVLAQGVPVAGQSARPIVLAVGDAAGTRAWTPAAAPAGGESRTRALTAPWMAEALEAIGADEMLREAIASSGAPTPDGAAANASGEEAPATSPRQSSGDSDAAAATTSPSATAGAAGADGSATPLVLFRTIGEAPIVTARTTSLSRGSASASSAVASRETPAADAAPSNAPVSSARADASAAPEALLIASSAPADSDVTALLLRAALRATADGDPLPRAEVARIPDAQLASWQRPAGLPPIEELTRVESHDRRWFWAAVLLLLLVERIVRGRMRRREPESPEVAHAA